MIGYNAARLYLAQHQPANADVNLVALTECLIKVFNNIIKMFAQNMNYTLLKDCFMKHYESFYYYLFQRTFKMNIMYEPANRKHS